MKATAWILSITDTLSVSVGEFELVHILPDQPVLFSVPGSPDYCRQVFVWQNKIIPVMNLAARLGLAEKTLVITNDPIVGIFAYRAENTGAPGYGALLLKETPYRYEVGDDEGCILPTPLNYLEHYVSSCFKCEGEQEAIAIIRLNRLFSASVSARLNH